MGFFNKKKSPPSVAEKESETNAAAPAVSVPKRGDASAYRVIIGPQVTEKASLGNSLGKYVFRVRDEAGKIAIKQSIEKLYGVSVRNVHVLHVPAKSRQVGRHLGERSGYKKAIVTLKKGDSIDVVA